ncbi:hypothetical protein [Piscinibacter defluvii]|uniref:hypothetical protein n=1 Tax=Piscinibacter defluvii TaxID=1796922 RepID=UPI000FDD3850|nr:hypothetical protein [Piscinibacter defluvii]
MRRAYPPLEGQFKDFQAFFQDWLDIPRDLPIAKVVNALTSLNTIADRAEREKEALAIYKRAEKVLRPAFGKPVPRPSWMSVFENEAVFVDHHGRLVETSESLYANDAPAIAELFQDEEDLSFLAVPREDVPRLSDSVTHRFNFEALGFAVTPQPSAYGAKVLALADKLTELAVACLLRSQATAYTMCHGRCLPCPLP